MLSNNLICLALAAFMAKTVSSAAVASSSDVTSTGSPTPVSSDVTSTATPVTSVVASSSATTSAVATSTPVPATSTVLASTTTPAPPAGSAPASFLIHPNGNILKCLDVRGDVLANGTPVQIFDCNSTPAQNWIIGPGEGHIQLAGTNFCLDAGSSPANGVGMKIWQCFDNLPAQDWFYTNDDRIALTNQGFCLDLTNGVLTNSNQVQTWHCTNNDVNQVWTVSPGITIPA